MNLVGVSMSAKPEAGARASYHHGDLRAALLAAAEAILERDGAQALTLRAAARAAGVSHAAPAHHFGDLTGLLSELAAEGFGRFSAALEAAMAQAGPDPHARMPAMGRAYVGFARAHPGLFLLMYRSDRLDAARPALKAAIEAARQVLRSGLAARVAGRTSLAPLEAVAQAAAVWSLVHGFAMLLLDGRLRGLVGALPEGADADTLLDAVLSTTQVGTPNQSG